MLRILIADSRATVRSELRRVLAAVVQRCRLGEAGDYDQLRHWLDREPWDVVVLDLLLPGMSGLGIFDELKHEHPQVPLLVMSDSEDPLTAACCVQAGAAGYLCRSHLRPELLAALRTVLSGGVYVSQALALQPNPFVTTR